MEIPKFTDNMTQAQRIVMWNENAQMLKELKKVEMEQRKAICAMMFADPKIGTNTVDLGAGYKLKFVNGLETKLVPEAFNLIRAELPEHIVDNAVKFTPSLVAKGYKDLSDADKEKLDECLESKPKSPTLTLVEPKDE